MIGKILLTLLQIILLVGAIMFFLGAWDITGFNFVDDPMSDGSNMWNYLIASTLFWAAIFFFLVGIAMGRKNKEYEEDYEEDEEEWDDEENDTIKGSKKNKKFKSKRKKDEDDEEEW